ncbi:hypothetical protein D3C87_370770 [compost metagenome]
MKTNPLIGLLLLAGFLFTQAVNAQNYDYLRPLYRAAMNNAVYPDSSKIDWNLVAINSKNPDLIWKSFDGEPHVLMLAWISKKSLSYYPPKGQDTLYKTSSHLIWVTAAPQLKKWFHKQNPPDTNLRIKQLLGLPPVNEYSYFVEFWVKPADLIRPCPDSLINDNSCSTCFPDNVSKDYVTWFNQTRIDRYYQCDLYYQYPWTQLGYTYDWNPGNPTHRGMSEFVIKANSWVRIKHISTTKQYLTK